VICVYDSMFDVLCIIRCSVCIIRCWMSFDVTCVCHSMLDVLLQHLYTHDAHIRVCMCVRVCVHVYVRVHVREKELERKSLREGDRDSVCVCVCVCVCVRERLCLFVSVRSRFRTDFFLHIKNGVYTCMP